MLTIGQLADYVGVTPRAIRFYHQRGLLPEPERTASGYRSYAAQDVVDLQRIKVLTDAGVPLARVRELVDASPADMRAAIDEIDADLRKKIRALRQTRKALATLSQDEPFLPAGVAALHAELREFGISEATLLRERDAWVLINVLYPQLVDRWFTTQSAMMQDPEFRDLYLLTDQAAGWEGDDPRLEEIANRTFAWTRAHGPSDYDTWDDDPTAYALVTTYQTSPAWDRIKIRIEQLVAEFGLDT